MHEGNLVQGGGPRKVASAVGIDRVSGLQVALRAVDIGPGGTVDQRVRADLPHRACTASMS